MVEIIFKGAKVQTGDRVKIPKAIIDTLELRAGEKIVIRFDAEKRRIIVEEDQKEGKNKKRK